MPTNITIFPADIAEMSVSQLAAIAPAQKQARSTKPRCSHRLAEEGARKFDAALDQCYGEQARAALRESGRDFGTAHISDGPLHLKFELPKKVSWDQKQLAEIAERIVASRREGRGLPRHQVVRLRIPLHELAACLCNSSSPPLAPSGFRQAVFHLSIDSGNDHEHQSHRLAASTTAVHLRRTPP